MATTITNCAAAKIHELMQEEGDLALKLRVYISGGGCSGFKYGFSFEIEKQHDDYIFAKKVPNLVLPEKKNQHFIAHVVYQYLVSGALADFNMVVVWKLCNILLNVFTGRIDLVQLLVDPISYQYLKRAVVDYKSGTDGEYFTVINPDAKTTCGCGSSFSVDMT